MYVCTYMWTTPYWDHFPHASRTCGRDVTVWSTLACPSRGHRFRGGGGLGFRLFSGSVAQPRTVLGGLDVRVLIHPGRVLRLRLHQRPIALLLVVQQRQESRRDGDPVHIIGDHGAVGGRIGPAQEGIEDGPTATARGDLRPATLCIPDVSGPFRSAGEKRASHSHPHATHWCEYCTSPGRFRSRWHLHPSSGSTVSD
jgi:hypothetical protein